MENYRSKIESNPIYLDIDDGYLQKNKLIPLLEAENKVVILSSYFDYNLISNLELKLNKTIDLKLISNEQLEELSYLYFYNKSDSFDIFKLDDDKSNKEIIDYLNKLIEYSINNEITDIHIEPFKDFIRIRTRLDGKLLLYDKLSTDKLSVINTRLKIIGGLDISEKRLPQDGRITFTYKNRDVDLRIATVPVIHGEKISIRVLDSGLKYTKLDNLGLRDPYINMLKNNVSKNHGFILVCGPTSSGKSTTVAALLAYLNKEDINIVTLEDPIEYKIEGINQIEINYNTGLTFEKTLNAILRHDPEVISIGELRSYETISTGLRASMTGHMVLSTIHTKDSISSIYRLKDMGAKDYLIANSLNLVVSQRLIRVLCDNCKEKYIDRSDYFENPTELYRPVGCEKCINGFSGRRGIFEILEIDDDIKELINNGEAYSVILKAAKKRGFTTLKEEFDKLLIDGKTSIGEYIVI